MSSGEASEEDSPREHLDSHLAARTGGGSSIKAMGRRKDAHLMDADLDMELEEIGCGMSGPVLLATHRRSGRHYAVKRLSKTALPEHELECMRTEVDIYLSLDHPLVIKLAYVYEGPEQIHLVMEYADGGELYDELAERGRFTEDDAAVAARQMLEAVAYLHDEGIVHRDLKLDNFLYERRGSAILKLLDFGLSARLGPGGTLSQACGTLVYAAPEVLRGAYTEKADVWSLGVVVYTLLTGKPLFQGPKRQVMAKVRAGRLEWADEFFELSPEAQNFVKALLEPNPRTRTSARAALDLPWAKNCGRAGDPVPTISTSTLESLQVFSRASPFFQAGLSIMAWVLSTKDCEDLMPIFMQMNKSRSGSVDKSEFVQALVGDVGLDRVDAGVLFESLDVRESGKLSYCDIMAAVLERQIGLTDANLRATYDRFDVDGTGRLSADNLRSVLGNSFDGCDADELFAEVDVRGVGSISYEEFAAYFLGECSFARHVSWVTI